MKARDWPKSSKCRSSFLLYFAVLSDIMSCPAPTSWWIPTYEEASKLQYFEAFLHETLRLHPSVPLDGKLSVKPTTLPVGGYHIPAGVIKMCRILPRTFHLMLRVLL